MTATRISIRIGLTAGITVAISTVAASSSLAYSARAQQMCMGDAFRLCSSEIPNIARITACMRRNKANLSAGCRAVMEQEDGSIARAKPVEQKPAAVSRGEQPAATRPPVQAAPVERKPAAPPVALPAAAETTPVQAAPADQKPPVVSRTEPPAATSPPVQAAPVEQELVTAAPFGSLAWTGTKAVRAAAVEQEPAITSPVAQPNAVETKPVQAATVEHKPVVAEPVDVKPVTAKPAPEGKPAKVDRHKQKPRQKNVAGYDHHGADLDRAMAIALPILSAILQSW